MTTVEPSTFGALLRRHRVEAGLTQEELAERARISARAVSDLERGVYQTPKMWTARQLAEALDLQGESRASFDAAARGTTGRPTGSPTQPEPAATGTSNLPASPTPFLGRNREIESVRETLLRPEVRLLTLTGPGGTGKTRLAIEAARGALREFPDGVYFVSLAPIDTPDAVPGTIARSFGSIAGNDGLTQASLSETIGDRSVLLLLDNFEHLLAAAASVRDLLDACQNLRILITSRVLLHLSGEHHFPVPAMSLPDASHGETPEGLRAHDATALFLERARAVNPSFEVTRENAPVIAAICTRLDGLPLAIELAAARVTVLPPQSLLDRLSQGLDVLRRGARDAPERQQTMRGAIDWSYQLLGKREQTLLATLSVFSGGCTLEAAEAVRGDGDTLDDLTSLVESSLVRTEQGVGGEPRFLLLETIREYALERLRGRDEEDPARRRHAEYFLDLAERVYEDLSSARIGPPQLPFGLMLIEQEHDNIVAALDWLRAHEEWVLGMRLISALHPALQALLRHHEKGVWLHAFAPHRDDAPPLVRARFLFALADYELDMEPDPERRSDWIAVLDESLSVYRAAGDESRLLRGLVAAASHMVYHHPRPIDAPERAEELFAEILELGRKLGASRAVAGSLRGLGWIAERAKQDRSQAREHYEGALAVDRAAGHTDRLADSLKPLGLLLFGLGEVDRGSALLRECIDLRRSDGVRAELFDTLLQYGGVQLLAGNRGAVRDLFQEARETGVDLPFAFGWEIYWKQWMILAASAATPSQARPAALLWAFAGPLFDEIKPQVMPQFAELVEALEAVREQLRAALGEDAWNEVQEEARPLSMEEAMGLALQLVEAPDESR